jgi:Trypsin-like peptidase domain
MLLLLSLALSAQNIPQMKKTVAFVYGHAHIPDAKGNPILLDGPLGTAFFVAYPDPRLGADGGFTYIVTAKHVLKDEFEKRYLDRVRIRLNKKDGTDVAFADIPVSDKDGKLIWFDDKDDPNADVAIAPCLPDSNKVDFKTIPLLLFNDDASLKKANVTEGDQAYLVGLMPQFTGEHRNYPVVRHGYIALLSDEPIPFGAGIKEKVYALELGSWPGQSGSPVFLNLGGFRNGGMIAGDQWSFLGLMIGFVANQRPFDMVSPTVSGFIGDASNVGISYVLPAAEILKVLNSKEAQEQRDAEVKAIK